uniref:Uncharacterized protein n=1 Tax=Ananas comosus var. bracteatus TaxID=296719 RepID=A0A6V7PWS2_ANACO|nr:unnamed protein product [Ananas comosus var. bracteatus]
MRPPTATRSLLSGKNSFLFSTSFDLTSILDPLLVLFRSSCLKIMREMASCFFWTPACSVGPERSDTVSENSPLSGATSQEDVKVGDQMLNSSHCSGGKGDILKSVIKLQNLTSQEKLECLKLRQTRRQTRRQERTAKLIQMSEEDEIQMRQTAIERSNNFNTTVWMMRHPRSKNDTLLKIMNNQIVMAKVYASIARSRDMTALHDSLTKCIKESQHVMLGHVLMLNYKQAHVNMQKPWAKLYLWQNTTCMIVP